MVDHAANEAPFRATFFLRDGLAEVQVVPRVRDEVRPEEVHGGTLRGRDELLEFLNTIELGCVVGYGHAGVVFRPSTPERIVEAAEARLRAEDATVDRLIEGEPVTEEDLARPPLVAFVLGAWDLDVRDGVRRTREFFERHGADR